MDVVEVNVSDLATMVSPYNPRRIDDHDMDALRRSLRYFGTVEPIVVNKRSGRIVGGHQRVKAAKAEGMESLPVVYVDIDDPSEKQLNLALNRIHGEWEPDLLGNLLRELEAEGADLALTGFAEAELALLMAEAIEASGEGSSDVDTVPPIEAVAHTKAGDLIVMGHHRLLCGDSRDAADVDRLIDAPINLAFTSPPYASQREYDTSSGFDPVPPDKYVEWFAPVAANVKRHLEADGSWFVNIKASCDGPDTFLYVHDLVIAHARAWGWHYATEFCWERNGMPKSVTQRFKNQFEPIYQFALGRWKMRPDAVRHTSENVPTAGGKGVGDTSWDSLQGSRDVFGAARSARKRKGGTTEFMSDVQGVSAAPAEFIGPGMAYPGNRIPTLSSSHTALGHAASFPVGLPEFFVKAYTDDGDAVFDPFMGSGSTLIAAEQQHRKCYGMELSPAYCDVIVKRWQDFTGKKAEGWRGNA